MNRVQQMLAGALLAAAAFMLWSQVVDAATNGVTIAPASQTTEVNERVGFKATVATDDGTRTEGTRVYFDDGGNGGSFFDGTVGLACTSDSEVTDLAIDQNKGFCYSNATPGTYTLTATVKDAADAVLGVTTMSVVVEEPAPMRDYYVSLTKVVLGEDNADLSQFTLTVNDQEAKHGDEVHLQSTEDSLEVTVF